MISIRVAGGQVCRAFAPSEEGRLFNPRSGHVKEKLTAVAFLVNSLPYKTQSRIVWPGVSIYCE